MLENFTRYTKLVTGVQWCPLAQDMEPNTIYIIEGPEEFLNCYENKPRKMAVFICPCGCKRSACCSLEAQKPEVTPGWALEIHEDQTVSFSPSIWANKPMMCGAHYFIKRGVVQWA